MDLKRSFGDDGPRPRPPKRRDVVMKGVSLNEIAMKMEPFLRGVVREEMGRSLVNLNPHNRIEASSGLELRFVSNIPATLFTGCKIKSEHNTAVKVVLLDAASNSIVASGPLSSAKLEIVALKSEFPLDQQSWTADDFSRSITHQRQGRRPLITGELHISLRDGVGYVRDVSFTDNSSWTRSRKFKLGARALTQVRIREAATEAFVVKDHRGELYKKHHPPQLHDEVWRLERIAKDGASHNRLAEHGINNLTDFLRMYYTNPSKLRRAIGGSISSRVWGIIIEHAKACIVNDNKFYVYFQDQVGIFFNSVYRAVGVTFDCQNCLCLDALNSPQKVFVEGLKRRAYKNAHDIVPIDQTALGDFGRPLESMQVEPLSVTKLSLQQPDFPITQEEAQLGVNNVEASASYAMEVPVTLKQKYNSDPASTFYPIVRNSFRMLGYSPGNDIGWSQDSLIGAQDIPEIQTETWSPALIWGQGNGLILGSGNEPEFEFLSCLPNLTRTNSRAGWSKIRAVIKWMISANQGVAATKKRRPSFMWNY